MGAAWRAGESFLRGGASARKRPLDSRPPAAKDSRPFRSRKSLPLAREKDLRARAAARHLRCRADGFAAGQAAAENAAPKDARGRRAAVAGGGIASAMERRRGG